MYVSSDFSVHSTVVPEQSCGMLQIPQILLRVTPLWSVGSLIRPPVEVTARTSEIPQT